MNTTTKEKILLGLFGIVTFGIGWLVWDVLEIIILSLTGGGS